jgi:hypothetical protein
MEKGNWMGFISKKLSYKMLKTARKKFFKRPFLANLHCKIKKNYLPQCTVHDEPKKNIKFLLHMGIKKL